MGSLLQIQTERIEPDITVVSLAGKVVLGPDSLQIENLVADLLKKKNLKFIFELSRVYYIDSTGMGIIAACFTRVKKAGGGFRLAAVADRVRELFKITHLDTMLAFYPTVLAASENFNLTEATGN